MYSICYISITNILVYNTIYYTIHYTLYTLQNIIEIKYSMIYSN